MLLQALLQVDPAQRPTAAAVCRDPWALDLPESPCDSLEYSDWGNACQHARPQDEHCHPRHDSEAGPAQEQHAVECTAQAMQHLWLQQEALMNGARHQKLPLHICHTAHAVYVIVACTCCTKSCTELSWGKC